MNHGAVLKIIAAIGFLRLTDRFWLSSPFKGRPSYHPGFQKNLAFIRDPCLDF
jgi:hypothetical protein